MSETLNVVEVQSDMEAEEKTLEEPLPRVVEEKKRETKSAEKRATGKAPLAAPVSNTAPQKDTISMKEFVFYIFFMLVFLFSTLVSKGGNVVFYMSKTMRDDVLTTEWDQASGGQKNFYDIANPLDVYDFIKYSVIPTLLTERYDNGYIMPPEEVHYFHDQRLLGIRIRMIRVKENTCGDGAWTKYSDFLTRPCYGKLSADNEDTRDMIGAKTGTKYKWSSAKDLGEVSFDAQIDEYQGGGYVVDLPNDQTEAIKVIDRLREDLFVREPGVRAVFIDWNSFNEQADLFMLGRAIIEAPASGGFRPKAIIVSQPAPKYHTTWEWLQLSSDCLIIVFCMIFIVEEVLELREEGWSYWSSYWNWLDWTNISLFLYSFFAKITTYYSFKDTQPIKSYPEYISLWDLRRTRVRENFVLAINAFLLWFKIFKFLEYNRRVMFLVTTIKRAKTELFFFMIVFFLLLMSFGHAGYLAFSDQATYFRSIPISFLTIVDSTTGDFDAEGLEEANRIWGPVFYLLFQFTIIVILMNMFLAIMNNAYMDEREDLLRDEQRKKILAARMPKLKKKKTTFFGGKKAAEEEVHPVEAKLSMRERAMRIKMAIRIQSIWRGFQARRVAKELEDALKDKLTKLNQDIENLKKLVNGLQEVLADNQVTINKIAPKT